MQNLGLSVGCLFNGVLHVKFQCHYVLKTVSFAIVGDGPVSFGDGINNHKNGTPSIYTWP